MPIRVVDYSPLWPEEFDEVSARLRASLDGVRWVSIEHVGSTSVPGLAAKPVLDIDVITDAGSVNSVIEALCAAGYRHRGDMGIPGRESMEAPDDAPPRHVYVCAEGALALRNHLAVRQVLRERSDLRDRYAAVKRDLAQDPHIAIEDYVAGKSAVLQEVLGLSELTEVEKREILRLNTRR